MKLKFAWMRKVTSTILKAVKKVFLILYTNHQQPCLTNSVDYRNNVGWKLNFVINPWYNFDEQTKNMKL